jgi:hypothetical protein
MTTDSPPKVTLAQRRTTRIRSATSTWAAAR